MTDVSTPLVLRMAQEYAARGWVAIPVYGLAANGRCECGADPCGREDSSAGKHPVGRRWQDAQPLSGPDRWAHWGEHPGRNIGILTGRPSGVFVLDIDPKADGLAELARLVGEHGPLPDTYTVRTGSGGRHYYFTMPDFDVRNSAGPRGRGIAPGIDIRGTGGMVVASPSVSGAGPYELVSHDVAPVVAPGWLLDMLRPAAAGAVSGVAPAPVVVEDLPALAELDPAERTRLQHYADGVLRTEATRYRQAPPGTGNAALFEAACSMIEIAQSPWNACTVDQVVDLLEQARHLRATEHGSRGGGQEPEEFRRTFQSAQGRVIGTGRPVPADRTAALVWDVPAGQDETVGAENLEVFDLGKPVSALERLRSRLHTRSTLDSIQPPVPLIEGVLDKGTMAVLAGQFGTFKTFTTIGWACSIATGVPWLGHGVANQGGVLYVAAEGASGLKKRVAAWERASGVTVPDEALQVLDVPVDLGSDEQCSALLTIAREMSAVLVVIDTVHRCTPGMDENDNTDMGRITRVADILREHAGATTLYVHHTGHTGTRSRGASSIESDADTVWITRLTGDESRDPKKARRLEQRKVKDAAELEPFFVCLDVDAEADSGVLVLVDESGVRIETDAPAGCDPFDQPRRQADLDQIQEAIRMEASVNAGLILQVFADVFAHHHSGVTQAQVRAVAYERYEGRPGWASGRNGSRRFTFARAWDRLLAIGAIDQGSGERWYVVPVDDRRPTDKPDK